VVIMEMITSTDGTTIAFDQLGSGPPLVLVSGAMCGRLADQAIAEALADQFTVLNYDRRGRGDGGDTGPYAVAREIEDLAAVLDAAGGSAVVVGLSSGGALVLLAAAAGLPIRAAVAWEVPYRTDAEGRRAAADYRRRTDELLVRGRRGEAVELFLRTVGVPEEAITGMQQSPFWAAGETIAPTLSYDAAVLGDGGVPVDRLERITCPTALFTGGAGPALFPAAAEAALAALPAGTHRVLENQVHDVDPAVLASAVAEFVGQTS
jgi:pimeloyl-ACP methyl ester carboxylesterase